MDRGILKSLPRDPELKDCSEYVRELREAQDKMIEAAQVQTAKVRDKRVEVDDEESKAEFKDSVWAIL